MTALVRSVPIRGRMTSLRATALAGGVLYLITFAASIPAGFRPSPVTADLVAPDATPVSR